MTQFRQRFEWYRPITFLLPVSSDWEHATLLMDMPILFAIAQDRRFYVEFFAEDLILDLPHKDLPHKDLRGLVVRKFKSNTHEVCSIALYEDNNAAIKRFCRYSLIPNANKPEIHVHNYPELLLTNIGNLTVEFGRINKTVDGCRSCIYVLESGCSLITETIFIASQREKFQVIQTKV